MSEPRHRPSPVRPMGRRAFLRGALALPFVGGALGAEPFGLVGEGSDEPVKDLRFFEGLRDDQGGCRVLSRQRSG